MYTPRDSHSHARINRSERTPRCGAPTFARRAAAAAAAAAASALCAYAYTAVSCAAIRRGGRALVGRSRNTPDRDNNNILKRNISLVRSKSSIFNSGVRRRHQWGFILFFCRHRRRRFFYIYIIPSRGGRAARRFPRRQLRRRRGVSRERGKVRRHFWFRKLLPACLLFMPSAVRSSPRRATSAAAAAATAPHNKRGHGPRARAQWGTVSIQTV